ncbi:hypothetical protein [Vibrio salinus]|uniref:hypothetical protein n=1 Tax=Vibrio salinus TaxID=2899784 RepID=UPI001E2DEF9C|nr:hypothetical protein [Vibrio salinus]MCE0494852.1 hypothetical protein [Vibrio salinus]
MNPEQQQVKLGMENYLKGLVKHSSQKIILSPGDNRAITQILLLLYARYRLNMD